LVTVGEALDRGHLAAGAVGHRRHTRLDLLAVQVTRARPAHPDAAAVLWPGDAELVPENPEQRQIRRRLNGDGFPVDRKGIAWHEQVSPSGARVRSRPGS